MDVGQLVKMGDSHLDKYTTIQYVMRWFGHSFSQKFYNQLFTRPADADYPKGSFQMEPNQDYHAFLSYRGAAGRFTLWLSLCRLFNFLPALGFTYILGPIFILLLHYLMIDGCNYSHWEWLVYSNSCYRLSGDRSWFIFRAYTAPIIILIILLWNPVFSFLYQRRRYFFDKYCIHQSDPTGKSAAGIARLPLFLAKSQTLISLFDQVYTTRMWCVFELAVFLRVRRKPKIRFVSMSMCIIEVVYLIVYLLSNLTVDCISDITEANEVFATDTYFTITWIKWVVSVFLAIFLFFLGDMHFRAVRALREDFKNYDVRNAKLACQSDAIFLLRIVDDLFRGDDNVDSVPSDTVLLKKGTALLVDVTPENASDENDSEEKNPKESGERGPAGEMTSSRYLNASGAWNGKEAWMHADPAMPAHPELVHMIEERQRADPNFKECWGQFCDSYCEGITDPCRHPGANVIHFLQMQGHLPKNQIPVGSPRSSKRASRKKSRDAQASGILAFNESLKTQIPRQLPVRGLRSWKLFGYVAAVLIYGVQDSLSFFDLWAYPNTSSDGAVAPPGMYSDISLAGQLNAWYSYKNFRSIVGVVFLAFVLMPFGAYLLCAEVKLFLSLAEYSKLSRVMGYVVFLPCLLVVESVLGFRALLVDNIRQVIGYQLLAGQSACLTGRAGAQSCGGDYKIWYNIFYGVGGGLPTNYFDGNPPGWIDFQEYYFNDSWYLQMCLYVFIFIPVLVFTYYVYEGEMLQRHRIKMWNKILSWMGVASVPNDKSSVSNYSSAPVGANSDDSIGFSVASKHEGSENTSRGSREYTHGDLESNQSFEYNHEYDLKANPVSFSGQCGADAQNRRSVSLNEGVKFDKGSQ